jgi:hypothetical protein
VRSTARRAAVRRGEASRRPSRRRYPNARDLPWRDAVPRVHERRRGAHSKRKPKFEGTPNPRRRGPGALQRRRYPTSTTSHGGTRALASMNVEETPIRNGNRRSKKRPTPRHRETGALQGGRIRTRATSCGGTRFADPTLLDHPSGCTACRLSSLRFGSRVHERRRDAHSKTEAKVRRNAQPVPPQNRSEAKITRAKPSLKHSRARDLFARAYVCPLLPTGRAIDSSSLIARPGNET